MSQKSNVAREEYRKELVVGHRYNENLEISKKTMASNASAFLAM